MYSSYSWALSPQKLKHQNSLSETRVAHLTFLPVIAPRIAVLLLLSNSYETILIINIILKHKCILYLVPNYVTGCGLWYQLGIMQCNNRSYLIYFSSQIQLISDNLFENAVESPFNSFSLLVFIIILVNEKNFSKGKSNLVDLIYCLHYHCKGI